MKKYIIANWKMNPTTEKAAKDLISTVKKGLKKVAPKKTEVIICPPFNYLDDVLASGLTTGSQDLFWEKDGKFTGEVSPVSLRDMGVTHSIIGHSERRALGETDEMVNKKLKAALSAGLKPILCIGESSRNEEGEYLSFIEDQLAAALSGIEKSDVKKIMVAYEPVWAIGGDEDDAMDAHSLHEMSIWIRKILTKLYDAETARKVIIIYGGSAEPENAIGLVGGGEVSGLLVGGASLHAEEFVEMVREVDTLK